MPEASYRRTQAFTVCRVTPYRRPTSADWWPSLTTDMTAAYRCSTTLRSTDIAYPRGVDRHGSVARLPGPWKGSAETVSKMYRSRDKGQGRPLRPVSP